VLDLHCFIEFIAEFFLAWQFMLNDDASIASTIVHRNQHIDNIECVLSKFLVRKIKHEGTQLNWKPCDLYLTVFFNIGYVLLISFGVDNSELRFRQLFDFKRWLRLLISRFNFFLHQFGFLDLARFTLVLFLDVCEKLVPGLLHALLNFYIVIKFAFGFA